MSRNFLDPYFVSMGSKPPTLLRAGLFALASGTMTMAIYGWYLEDLGQPMPGFWGNWVYWFYLALVAFGLSLAVRVWRFVKKKDE